MKRIILASALALGAVLGTPRQARADCLIDAVNSCDDDFGTANSNYYTISIRGWCYLIRAGLCGAGS